MWARREAGAAVRGGCLLAVILWFASAPAPAAEASGGTRVLYLERLPALTVASPSARPSGAGKAAVAADVRALSFQAYGRQFELSLEPNAGLAAIVEDTSSPSAATSPAGSALTPLQKAGMESRQGSLQLYRGHVDGSERSWVRLALKDGIARGMIWDGVDLYVIEPAAGREDLPPATSPGSASATPADDANVIFRLADVLMDAGAASCATEETAPDAIGVSGKQAYGALVQELKGSPAIMQAAGAARRLTISAIGDTRFLHRYGGLQAAREAILARLNNVDGIFSAQLGIEIHVEGVFVNEAGSDPLSDATSPNALLTELGKLRKRSPELRSSGLTHLFTGRDLAGTTIGIAYVGALCAPEHGAGLTQTLNAWRDSLVAAHEIGHNFGADHDGDPQGNCAAAPSGFLMAASVNGSEVFSQCSLERMRAQIQTASCITNLPPANVGVPRDLGTVRGPLAAPFDWRIDVTNAGGLSALDVRADLFLPPAMSVEDAYVSGGTCVSGAGVVQCQLGEVPGSAMRTIHLRLRSELAGSSPISIWLSSQRDSTLSNNRGVGTVVIAPQADLAVHLSGPASATVAQAFPIDFTIMNLTSTDATGVEVTFELPQSATLAAVSLANGECGPLDAGSQESRGGRVRCTLPTLVGNGHAIGRLSLQPSVPGGAVVQAGVSGAYMDPNAANDRAELAVSIEGMPVAAVQASGSGGGGALGLGWLLGLAGLAGVGAARRGGRPSGRPAATTGT